MRIREATLDDIELLIQLRLDFIVMTGAELSDETRRVLTRQLATYYRKHISLGDFISFVAEEEQTVLAAACMVIVERPAGPSFVTGVTGTILNVLTYPEYRQHGYSTLLIKSLICRGRELDVTAIDLNATPLGIGVYRKLGFRPIDDTAMRLKL